MIGLDPELNKYRIQFKLFERIGNAAEEKQLELLRYFYRGRLHREIFKLIVDLPENQQHSLFEQLTHMTHQERPETTIDLDERQAIRRKCSLPADYQDGQQSRRGRILDISTLGVFIETPHPIEIGKKLAMRFSFPEAERQLKIHGEIVRKDSKGIGVKFDPLATHEIDLIDRFVSEP